MSNSGTPLCKYNTFKSKHGHLCTLVISVVNLIFIFYLLVHKAEIRILCTHCDFPQLNFLHLKLQKVLCLKWSMPLRNSTEVQYFPSTLPPVIFLYSFLSFFPSKHINWVFHQIMTEHLLGIDVRWFCVCVSSSLSYYSSSTSSLLTSALQAEITFCSREVIIL